MEKVYKSNSLQIEAFGVLEKILQAIPGTWRSTHRGRPRADTELDIEIRSPRGKLYQFEVKARSRLNPQIALTVERDFQHLPKRVIPVIYAPVISTRVGEILRTQDISYADQAGNCWIHGREDDLLIDRQGYRHPGRLTRSGLDLFAPRSSRIVRAMLQTPLAGWKQRDLAEAAGVSLGLVVKAKPALISEGFAVEHERLLYLRDPVGLLKAWVAKYPARARVISLYLRGAVHEAEKKICDWLWKEKKREHLNYALSGMSAGWRLAPEVKYNVGSLYLENILMSDEGYLDAMCKAVGAKQVDSGANMTIWMPADSSVFVGAQENGGESEVVTTPIQTYLDLVSFAGRGEEAAQAVFNKYMKDDMERAAARAKEWHHGSN